MASHHYLLYDVFTQAPFSGNALAVFPDARGIAGTDMPRIARELNLSETTFVLPAERSDTDVRMRIFTPHVEMPMAGHPTVGSTFALEHAGVIAPGRSRFVFGLNVGPVPVDLEWPDGTLSFVWMTQTPGLVLTAREDGELQLWQRAKEFRPARLARVDADVGRAVHVRVG